MAKGAKRRSAKGRGRKDFYAQEETAERRQGFEAATVAQLDGQVRSDDDEEIDEDTAFDSADEEAFGAIFAQLAKRGKRKGAKTMAEEDEENEGDALEGDGEDEEDVGEGEMLLTDVLDANHAREPAVGSTATDPGLHSVAEARAKGRQNDHDGNRNLSSAAEGFEASSEDSDLSDSSPEDESAPVDFGALRAAVSDFGTLADLARHRERGAQHFASQLGEERELAAGLSGASKALSVSALKRGLEAPAAGAAPVLKQKVAPMVPRAARVQEERATRRVAYKQRNEDMKKWTGVVQAARRAEHLDFSNDVRVVTTAASLIQRFVPATELEKSVSAILQNAGASKDRVHGVGGSSLEDLEAEALDGKEVTEEELKERRAQLMKMRNMLFYDEQKRRRANKIKSKAFRRIQRRKRSRDGDGDGDDGPEVTEESEAAIEKRIKERMSLKHKSTSKWAKRVMSRGNKADKDERAAVMAQLRLGQELRHRMGVKVPQEDGGASDSSGDWDLEIGDDADDDKRRSKVLALAKGRAQALLDDITEDTGHADGSSGSGAPAPPKGLFGMKFMQKALQRQREEARREAEALLEELEEAARSGGDSDVDHGEAEDAPPSAASMPALPAKRSALTGGDVEYASEMAAPPLVRATGAVSVDLDDVAVRPLAAASKAQGDSSAAEAAQQTDKEGAAVQRNGAEVNPWLARSSRDAGSSGRSGSRHVGSVGIEGGLKVLAEQDRDKGKARGKTRRGTKGKGRGEGDETGVGKSATEGARAGKPNGPGKVNGGGGALQLKSSRGKRAREPSIEAETAPGASLASMSRDQLVKEAFADPVVDEVLEELATEKMREVEGEVDMEKSRRQRKRARKLRDEEEDDNAGWGTWAGTGVKQSRRQRLVKRQRKQEAVQKRQDLLKMRKDAFMDRVVISERRNTAAAGALQVGELPYPFTSREEYDRAMRLPMGRDWNTPRVAKALVRGPVKTRAGGIIAPASSVKVNRARAEAAKDMQMRRKAARTGKRRGAA